MDNQSWQEKINNAKCPEQWTYNMLGEDTLNGIRGLKFYPGTSNIESINSIKCKEEYTLCNIDLYTHGLIIWIADKYFRMTYKQIVDIDLIPYEETITLRESLFNHMGNGAAWGAFCGGAGGLIGATIGATVGSAVGSAIGSIAHTGRKNKTRSGKILRIAFWDADTKDLKYIFLDHSKPDELDKFLADWHKEKKINEETGRKPSKPSSGCLSIFVLLFISTLLCSFIIF